jgi:hypothetical protein
MSRLEASPAYKARYCTTIHDMQHGRGLLGSGLMGNGASDARRTAKKAKRRITLLILP